MIAVATSSLTTILNGEKLIGLRAAGKLLPGHRDNQHLNGSTIFRWVTKGAKNRSGQLVRLEAVRAGNRWLTSAEAVARFIAALGAEPSSDPATPQPTPAQRARAADRAHAELGEILGANAGA